MDNLKARKILKFAIAIYVASFLVFNWNNVSWIFNYKAVGGIVSDFFNPYPSISASSMGAYFYPNRNSKLSLSTPIIFSASTEKNVLEKDLESGVIYYPGSVYPGQEGQIVILGHSAPVGWPDIKYQWVFTKLNDLVEGDVILINLNNKQYTYIVRKKTIIKKGADVPASGATNTNELVLVSCWPPGKDYQRIAVQAELN